MDEKEGKSLGQLVSTAAIGAGSVLAGWAGDKVLDAVLLPRAEWVYSHACQSAEGFPADVEWATKPDAMSTEIPAVTGERGQVVPIGLAVERDIALPLQRPTTIRMVAEEQHALPLNKANPQTVVFDTGATSMTAREPAILVSASGVLRMPLPPEPLDDYLL